MRFSGFFVAWKFEFFMRFIPTQRMRHGKVTLFIYFIMGVSALWTATHYKIPLMMVVANNRSFFNVEYDAAIASTMVRSSR